MTAPVLNRPPAPAGAPTGLPRLLRAAGPGWADHLAARGPLPAASGLVAAVEAAGLRGRGGADFPTARKLRAVAAARGPVTVVANGAESEPASAKDALLLTRHPHLVLDGVEAAVRATGASRAIVAVHRGCAAARAVRAARDERPAGAVRVEIAELPPRYVASEETALVRWLGGGEARPLPGRGRPSERGVDGRPTLVDNVETLAHLALIARYGPAWFRGVGTAADPGSFLVTLAGAVRRPGVHEVARGSRAADLTALAGGWTGDVRAVLLGGYGGTWVAADRFAGATLDPAGLAAVGGTAGAGVVLALPATSCGLREAARVVGFMAGESANQCGHCAFGLPAIAAQLGELASARVTDVDRLRRWAFDVRGRGGCAHPDGVSRFVTTALEVFAEETARHLAGRCAADPAAAPVCPLPTPARTAAPTEQELSWT